MTNVAPIIIHFLQNQSELGQLGESNAFSKFPKDTSKPSILFLYFHNYILLALQKYKTSDKQIDVFAWNSSALYFLQNKPMFLRLIEPSIHQVSLRCDVCFDIFFATLEIPVFHKNILDLTPRDREVLILHFRLFMRSKWPLIEFWHDFTRQNH